MGGMYLDSEHIAQRISGHVAFTSFDLFAPINASILTGLLGLHRFTAPLGVTC